MSCSQGEYAGPLPKPGAPRCTANNRSARSRWHGGWSACCPGPEFVGVAYRPDVGDPVASDLERVHRHGDAVQLGDQAGLAVDRALQDRQARCSAGDLDVGAGDLLAAFDGLEVCGGQAATVIADSGGLADAVTLRPIEGAERIARYVLAAANRAPGLTILERTVNGQPGLIAQQDGVTVTVAAFDIAGDRIKHIWAIRNPDKLRLWTTG